MTIEKIASLNEPKNKAERYSQMDDYIKNVQDL